MQFDAEDNGNCRVYYRDEKRLYCWQMDDYRAKTFRFYVCSRDGEPSHEVGPKPTPQTPGETSIGLELNSFLADLDAAMALGSKHTPGPWRYEPETETIRSVPQNYWLASMNSWDGQVKPRNAANARLIAAAPDLLEILQHVLTRLDLEPVEAVFPCSAMREDIRAAIVKASA